MPRRAIDAAHPIERVRGDLQPLAIAVRDLPGIRVVILGSAPAAGGVAMVAAVTPDGGLDAGQLLAGPAKTVGGGAGRGKDVSVAGGREPGRLEEALEQARVTVGLRGPNGMDGGAPA